MISVSGIIYAQPLLFNVIRLICRSAYFFLQLEQASSNIPSIMNKLNIDSRVTMNDGNQIPLLGFGVFQLDDPEVCEAAVQAALNAGYRHIDTAFVYNNEEQVGNAIAASGVPREEIFLTTKSAFDHSEAKIREVFTGSLERLKTDYVDLFLIHWPLDDATLPEAWETLIKLKDEGVCRSIGVSNISVKRF